MNGIGTLVNLLAVLVGGGFGTMLGGRMKVKYQQMLVQTVGLLLMGVGLYQGIRTYFVISGGKVEMSGMMLVLFSLVCGLAVGIALNMERLLTMWGKYLSQKAEKEKMLDQKRREKMQAELDKASSHGKPLPKIPFLDRFDVYEIPSVRSGNLYADGLVAACLVVCVNAMLLSGVYEDCINGDTTILIAKSIIDLVLCFALAFVFGGGVLYAAIPLAVIEGFWTVLFLLVNYLPFSGIADMILNVMTVDVMNQLSLIGAVLTVGTGVCLAFGKKFKVANLMPAFLIPVIYEFVMKLVDKLVGQ